MNLSALTAALLVGTAAAAATPTAPPVVPVLRGALSVRVLTPDLPEAHAAAVQQAVAAHLGELVDWPLQPAPSGGPCEDPACLRELAQAAFGLEVVARANDRILEIRAGFADAASGQVVRKVVKGGTPAQPERAVRMVLEAALPAWSRKGKASVAVQAPSDAVVKVDGRRVALVPLPEPLGLAAGAHDIDLLLPSGQAVLYRQRLDAGDRLTLATGPFALPTTTGEETVLWRRPLAYGLWSAGALAVATSLIYGGLSRRAQTDLQPCGVQERDCLRVDQAERASARAAGFARTGNVLLVSGGLLAAGGAGVFVFDLLGPSGGSGSAQ